MRNALKTGICLLAIGAVWNDGAMARRATSKCADPSEVSALQTAAVQQELMDAALGCGDQALQKFNAFQTSFSGELRRSDRTLLTMFKRVYGPSRGDAAYNLFKTNMASKAEIRRVHGIGDFCKAADEVFAAALAPDKPALDDFVSGVQIQDTDESPVGQCQIRVAVTLKGAMAAPDIVPKPNPLRVAMATPVESPVIAPPPAPTPVTPEPAAQAPAPSPKPQSSGWLSGIFH